MHVNVSGVWKEIPDPQVNVSGVWKEINEGWVNVSGVWKQFYARIIILLNPVGVFTFGGGGDVSSGVRVNRAGTYEAGGNSLSHSPSYSSAGADNWTNQQAATVGDGYHCRLVRSTGTLAVGTADTWLALTSNREFVVWEGGSFTGTMQISDDGGTTVVGSGVVNLTADNI